MSARMHEACGDLDARRRWSGKVQTALRRAITIFETMVAMSVFSLLAALLFVVLFPERHAIPADDGHPVAVISEKATRLDQHR